VISLKSGTARKLVGSLVLTASVVGLAACGGDDGTTLGKSADIIIDNQGITPKESQIQVGKEVVISVLNNDTRTHSFTLPYIAVDEDNFIDEAIAPGERIEVKIKATEIPSAGFYSFYSKDSQFEGYQGKINVVE